MRFDDRLAVAWEGGGLWRESGTAIIYFRPLMMSISVRF